MLRLKKNETVEKLNLFKSWYQEIKPKKKKTTARKTVHFWFSTNVKTVHFWFSYSKERQQV